MNRAVRRFIPPQHGAWAMLLVPWLAGVLAAGFRWLHLPLLVAWVAGYLFSYYGLQAVKTGRPGRVRAQLLAYGLPTALLGGVVVVLRPAVLWYAPAYAVLLTVNLAYARRRAERALTNDLASVVLSCLVVLVCATVAGQPAVAVVPVAVAVAAYFTGTVLYVKTMIRERDSAPHYWGSVGFHAAALAVAVFASLPLLVVFLLLLVRAAVNPRLGLTPKQVGLTEIAASVLVLTAVVV